jgi:TrmH family RNA methyltransferase
MLSRQQIKFIRSLHQKKYRDESGRYLVEGLKMVKEAIQNQPQNIDRVVISSEIREQINLDSVISAVEKIEINRAEFEKLSSLKTPSGILAVIKKTIETIPSISDLKDITLMLDQVSDPGNLGTIIRMADWFGIRHIICSPDTVECYNPKVAQASMGALFRVTISYTPLEDFLLTAKQGKQISVYGTSLAGSDLYKMPLQTPALIVLGNETKGLSKTMEALVDNILHIPNFNKAPEKSESLNVSIAAAIVCSEFRRKLG